MKILSINFGFNGSLSLIEDSKIIKHTSFHKINYGNDRNIIKRKTLSEFLTDTDTLLLDLEYVVFSGYKSQDIDIDLSLIHI